MQDNDNRQTGDSTKKVPQEEQGSRQRNQGGYSGGQQGSGQGGQKRGGSYAEKIEREGERKGDHNQGGKNNEQSRHTDKGQGL